VGAFTDWIQLGAFGVIACAFLWGLVKGFPRVLDKYAEALDVFSKALAEERDSREAQLAAERKVRDQMLAAERESRERMHQMHLETLGAVGEECHAVQREANTVLDRTREALVRVESALERRG